MKRHFHELGMNAQTDLFTVAGIGSMSGDVFGNGMLLSPCIKLVAAFNHGQIFIDPTPDPEVSFQERARLFKLPKSSWGDYSTQLISAGGGVYQRSAKSIELSEQARLTLGVVAQRLTPNELIQAILRAPVDLLWNGAIGTYVKATNETHADVGDRTNDAVRVNGAELRCRVVGEGGNLGFTQLGRVEYAQGGGAINTDFIDNSGGVDCSDLEVNIKILLGQVVANGDMTLKQRDELLVTMTDAVASLVLRHSYQQTQAISIAAAQSTVMLADHARFIRSLEKKGQLKRRLEFLPNDDELVERQKHKVGLTRPEIAIFFSYSKIELYRALHASDISEDPYLAAELITYFPEHIQKRFVYVMQHHPLRREIISTQITNSLVNRMGGTFVMRLEDLTGASVVDIARCYTAAREIYNVHTLWQSIESLDIICTAAVQIEMLCEVRRLLDRATVWLLRHKPQPIDIAIIIEEYQLVLDQLQNDLPQMLLAMGRESVDVRCQVYVDAGVPAGLAQHIVLLDAMYAGLDILALTQSTNLDLMNAAAIFFEIEERLRLFWLRTRIHDLPRDDLWQRKARLGLLDELQTVTTDIARQVIGSIDSIMTPDNILDQWQARQQSRIDHCLEMLDEIEGHPEPDLAMYTVAVREVKVLTHDAINPE